MGKSQRTKGAVGEREVAALFSAALYEEFKRNIGQARDGGNDIDVGPLRVEVKRRKTLGTVYGWLQQAIASLTKPEHIPVVVARQDGGEWIVITRLDDFLAMAQSHLGVVVVPDGGFR